MNSTSYFESRTGKIKGTALEAFNFVTDIRNFEQFIPEKGISNWQASNDSCSFSVPMVGSVRLRIAEMDMPGKVVYLGDALKKEDFTLVLNISDKGKDPAEVKVSLNADLNPMMKMMAAKPIEQFLEMLIEHMESFGGWKNIKE
jgi:carbon monoxide dehydrogenase subunit G